MHFIARTQKILTFMSLTGECRQQKHTQHAPSTKTECYYLNGWIKKRSHTQKSHPKVVNPRDIAGERQKKKGKKPQKTNKAKQKNHQKTFIISVVKNLPFTSKTGGWWLQKLTPSAQSAKRGDNYLNCRAGKRGLVGKTQEEEEEEEFRQDLEG